MDFDLLCCNSWKEIEDHEELQSYDEAISSKDSLKWIEAMKEEMVSLEKNQT